MLVRQIFDERLAQFAYLVGCPATGEAAVIDPERDVDQYVALAERNGLKLVAAMDTHIHADYLSGMRELAEAGMKVYASDEGPVDWKYEWLLGSTYRYQLVRHGDRFLVGNIEFEVIHTPGHTPEHVAYLIRDTGSGAEDPIAIATGDFVFVSDMGRPDLLETAAGVKGTMEPGARALFRSIESFRRLPEFLQVWPGHGAGSACGKALGNVPLTTVGYELRNNVALQAATSEQEFVTFILSGQPEPPPYFARMKRDNKVGPALLHGVPHPPRLGADALAMLAGRTDVVVLDARGRGEFLEGHLPASLLAELDYQFPAVVGSYVDEGAAIYLVVEGARLDEAVRSLVRIGLDGIRGYVTPETLAEYAAGGGRLVQTETIDMVELERRRLGGGVTILDVRGSAEYAVHHVPGALNIAHTRLLVRLGEVPVDRQVIVHCNSGGRSAAAAALLERHGYRVADVDDLVANYRPGVLTAVPA